MSNKTVGIILAICLALLALGTYRSLGSNTPDIKPSNSINSSQLEYMDNE